MNDIQARGAQIIGLQHVMRQTNCQDNFALIQTDACLVGVVCDGCSEGARSEVGAALAAEYIARQAVTLYEAGHDVEAIPPLLHAQTVHFLHELVNLSGPRNPVDFIQKHLLFTVVGLVLTNNGGVIFTAGDGLVAMDDHVICIDQHNQPAYIAYHLLRDELDRSFQMPDTFEVYPLRPDWQRLVIASDGFLPELLPDVWGIKHPRGLQRKLNVWANQELRFQDDATLIVVERQAGDESGRN